MDNDADVDAGAIAFGTDGWRATLDVFTKPRVRMVGQAVATTLAERGASGTVAIGYDARETSPGFADELAHVLRRTASTCSCRSGTRRRRSSPDARRPRPLGGAHGHGLAQPAGVQRREVHPSDGAPALPDVDGRLEDNLAERGPAPRRRAGRATDEDLIRPHHDHALDLVDTDLDDLTVAYDAHTAVAAASPTPCSKRPGPM